MENHTWSVRVCAKNREHTDVFVRKHQFKVGASVQFDEDHPHITALEHVLGALGADMVHGLHDLARKRRVEIDDVECVVQGVLNNPLTHIGVVGETGHPGIERIAVKIYISSFESETAIRRIWDEMLEKSPLVHTFKQALVLDLSFQIVI